jgi:hypothetical protein
MYNKKIMWKRVGNCYTHYLLHFEVEIKELFSQELDSQHSLAFGVEI